MKNSNVKRRLSRLLAGLCGAALMFGLSACTDDLLVGTPEWLGTSIYEELESRGDYSVTLALINSSPVAADNNYREMLSRTGSKTLFVADDAAWQRFFDKNKQLPSRNPWSTITSVESFNASGNELKVRRLFKSMMLDNAYVLDLLGKDFNASNVNVEGASDARMRRKTSIGNFELRAEVKSEDYPAKKQQYITGEEDVDWWAEVRDKSAIVTMPAVLDEKGNNLPVGQSLYSSDGDPDLPTMVHFSPSFAVSNHFTDEDVRILSGGVANSTSQTVVNGVAIDPDNSNITCQNGYIHKMVEVPYPVSNMVERLSYEPNYSIFYSQLQRFSYPYKNEAQARTLGLSGDDDVYTVRYFNSGMYAGHCSLIQSYENKMTATSFLPYDPAWNMYYPLGEGVDYMQNAALMLVPNNEQMTSFLSEPKKGKELSDKYVPAGQAASWDFFPDHIVAELMQNCLRPDFITNRPSNISNIKDTSSQPIDGLTTDKIADCFVCGNGVIYGLSTNITPPSYNNVISTLLINKDEDKTDDKGFSVFYNFIQEDANIKGSSAGYASYLASKDGTQYVLFCPYDKALRQVVDPSSLTRPSNGKILFRYNYDASGRILPYAEPYTYTQNADGSVSPGSRDDDLFYQSKDFTPIQVDREHKNNSTWYDGIAYKMLKYIIENNICPVYNLPADAIPLEPRYTYYKTKAGSAIKVNWGTTSDIKGAGYAGGYQTYYNRYISSPVAMQKSNGATLPVEEVLLPAMQSPYYVLKNKFPGFFKILELSDGTDVSRTEYLTESDGDSKHTLLDANNRALKPLRPYNYTIYVPTDAAIDKQVNTYQLARRRWLMEIPSSDDKIKEKFPGITEEELKELKELKGFISKSLDSYLLYHIQDYGVFLGQRDTVGVFETSLVNPENNLFYGLHVDEHSSVSGTERYLKVYPKDYRDKEVEIEKNEDLCNIQATQNFYIATDYKDKAYGKIYSSSYVVIHQIAHDEDLYMPEEINPWNKARYDRLAEIFIKAGGLPEPVQN